MTYEAIILDTETTDVEDCEVIQLAWESYPGAEQGRGMFFLPEKAPTLGALATHHILMEDLEGCQPAKDAPLQLPPQARYWIGHNVDFDWRALGQPHSVRRICTLAMARSIWPQLNSHSLTAMMYFLYGATKQTREMVKGAHGAGVDVYLCRLVLNRIVEMEGLTELSDLYEFSENARIPKIMSFGKFKGQPVSNVDKGWANWYARQEDTDPYLITALKRARKL